MSHYGVAPIAFESVSAVTATNSVDLGTTREYAGEQYRYVYNAGNSQASPGQGMVVTSVSGYSVTVSSVTMNDLFVGVVKHTTFTTATYGWLLTQGYAPVKAPAGSIFTAGDLLGAGGDGVWTKRVSANTDTLLIQAQGKCTVATASAGVGLAYVRCLG